VKPVRSYPKNVQSTAPIFKLRSGESFADTEFRRYCRRIDASPATCSERRDRIVDKETRCATEDAAAHGISGADLPRR
jgi:hypothetical protein